MTVNSEARRPSRRLWLILSIILHCSGVSAAELFVRGDVDGNGQIEVTDAVLVLGYLFRGEMSAVGLPGCGGCRRQWGSRHNRRRRLSELPLSRRRCTATPLSTLRGRSERRRTRLPPRDCVRSDVQLLRQAVRGGCGIRCR